MDTTDDEGQQFDLSDGRSGDWRRAPRTWAPYHPSHDDYQTPGNCRRWIARCLNMGTRVCCLDQQEVLRAFSEAREGLPVVLSFADHDFRDIRPNVDGVRQMLAVAQKEYPEVEVHFCEALEAMRSALQLPWQAPCELDVDLKESGGAHVLSVRTKTPSFGPQPYLALKTRTQQYLHDNFDFQVPGHEWTYVFDMETFPLNALESIGVACANARGAVTVVKMDVATGAVQRAVHGAE